MANLVAPTEPLAVTNPYDFFSVDEDEIADGVYKHELLFAVRAGVPTEAAEAFADVALGTAESLLDKALDDGSPIDGDLVHACRVLITLGRAVYCAIPSAPSLLVGVE